jgi:SPP1 gp7 family putative phage head morphogenesis protein
MLKGNVEQAIKEGMSTAELADTLADSYAFSDARAETIARTELAAANVQGTLAGYKESGLVEKIEWLVSQEDTCDECMDMLDKVGTIDDGIDGEFPPLHPNCRCDIVPILSDASEGEE